MNIPKANKIAIDSLRSCYTSRGILTGSRKVYWSWDSFFASFGSLALGDFGIVKKNLKLYLDSQNKNGNIPKRIANPFYALKFLKFPISEKWSNQKPNYRSPYYTGISISQCPVLIISFYEYIEATNDLNFLKKNLSKLQKIFNFLDCHKYKNGLLKEAVGGGWAESVLKRGAISYTNMCYARSLYCMSKLCSKINLQKDSKSFHKNFLEIKEAINKNLWHDKREGFYSDWVGLNRHHYFNSDGNLLAILWNIADSNQAKKIEKHLDRLVKVSHPPLALTRDSYFFWRIFFTNQIAGLKNYHTTFSWLWLGCLTALAKQKLGKINQAKEIINEITNAIIKEGTVNKIFENGKPTHSLFYKSEKPWAWSAGLFIYTCKKLKLV